MSQFIVRKAAVLGAGVMGAQIAAHFVNARVPVILFDLPAREGPSNGIACKAIEGLARLSPAPLADAQLAAHIEPADYDHDLARLGECDLVIEAIAERMDLKLDLYRRIAPHLGPQAVLASNTSGLSISALAEALPEALRPRFCGVHFFNPPRYMYLVELIASPLTDPQVTNRLEPFLVSVMGKGVIRAKDTPNFIANRFGIFSMLATMLNAERFGLGFDVADDLTGSRLGRSKSATFRTADVVGLDTMAHVIRTMADTLPDDPWHAYFRSPAWMTRLIEKGALGQKTRSGIYTKQGKDILVLDPARDSYGPAGGQASETVRQILGLKSASERFAALRASTDPHARFLWAIQRDLFHYCAYHLAAVADNARDVDLALRWGFAWSAGPFETWQNAGWQQVAAWIDADIREGKALTDRPLPAWAADPARAGVHFLQGSYSASRAQDVPRSHLPVYTRQAFPPGVSGEKAPDAGRTITESAASRLWVGSTASEGQDVAVLSFKTKMHVVSEAVLEDLLRAIERAQAGFAGLVLWPADEPFSVGADLSAIAPLVAQGRFDQIGQAVAHFQQASMAIKYAQVPVVAAVRGLALGGGAELLMHCARTVAAFESFIGLVETGIGLIPSAGGCKEIARRCARDAGGETCLLAFVRKRFETVAAAAVSRNAIEARSMGYLRDADVIAMNAHETLYLARQTVRSLADLGYRPTLPGQRFAVLGSGGIATLQAMLLNLRDSATISSHDYTVGLALAETLCGGRVEPGSLVDEQWMLDIERQQFVELLRHPLTQARIAHTLQTGKPLRN